LSAQCFYLEKQNILILIQYYDNQYIKFYLVSVLTLQMLNIVSYSTILYIVL